MSNQILERERTSYPLYFVNYQRVQEKEIFCQFVEWCALPREVREPKTQGQFAQMHGLHIDTLTDWKKREGFQEEVDRYRISYFREFASDIYYALVQRALTGNVPAVRLYVEIFEGFRA